MNPQPPAYTPSSIAAGCLALVALVAMGGCTAAVFFSGEGSEPVEESSPALSEDEVLDEWTEQIFGLSWDNMDADQREALCVEVDYYGPGEAAELITDQMSDSSDVDEDTLVAILTDNCG